MGATPGRTSRGRDPISRLLLDITAGREPEVSRTATDATLRLAHRHGLLGLMATSPWPELSRPAKASYVRWSSRRAIMERHLARLLHTFAERGVPITPLKGPHLSELVYKDPRVRLFSDLDVLIRPSDLETALDLIRDDPAVTSIPRKRPTADKREIPIRDDDTGIVFNLDVHWDLFSYTQLRGCANGATAEGWHNALGPEESALGPIWRIPDSTRIVFLCTHALLDHRFRLILFRDLAEFADQPIDWSGVVEVATRWRLRSFAYLGLLIAEQAAEARVPSEVMQALRPSSLNLRMIEAMLPRTDLVTFDGHKPHPLNLAIVLLHDDRSERASLLARAPAAFPDWRRRVGTATSSRTANRQSISLLVTSDHRRGAEVFGERLRDCLRTRGWEAELIALSSAESDETVSARPISNRSSAELARLDFAVLRALRRDIRAKATPVIMANGSATLQHSLAALIGMRHRPRLAFLSIGEPKYWQRNKWRAAVQRLMLGRVDLILAVSEVTKQQLIDLGVAAERIEVAHTGVPRSYFEIVPAPRGQEFRLLFLGNLSREKGPTRALEVVEHLGRSLTVNLRFVGTGPLRPSLEELAARLDIDEQVEFLGSVGDVRSHMAWADALVLCSETEGLPGAVLEAGAAGVPAVAFDVGGTREAIVDGITGRLVPPGDIAAMVDVLRGWAADPSSRLEIGREARRFVAETFTLEQAADQYDRLLSRLLRSG